MSECSSCHCKCECGFDPSTPGLNSKQKDRCPISQALSNHITFPSYDMVPHGFGYEFATRKPQIKSNLYQDKNSQTKRHYAIIAQLDQKYNTFGMFPCDNWLAYNKYEEEWDLRVYLDYSEREKPTTFNVENDFKQGNTFVMLYPENNGCLMINFTNYSNCFIFKSSMLNVYNEANSLLLNEDSKHDKSLFTCFTCGIQCKTMSVCSKCKLARYCSKECQVKGWKACHKDLCAQDDILLRLASLPRCEWTKNSTEFTFERNSEDFIPSYKPFDSTIYKTSKRVLGSIQNMQIN